MRIYIHTSIQTYIYGEQLPSPLCEASKFVHLDLHRIHLIYYLIYLFILFCFIDLLFDLFIDFTFFFCIFLSQVARIWTCIAFIAFIYLFIFLILFTSCKFAHLDLNRMYLICLFTCFIS
jgi:hypothetical protein